MLNHDFLLLDRSGSMGYGNMMTEAVNSINAYVEELAKNNVDTGVTLIVFDSINPFEIVRDRITPKTWRKITVDEVAPRGGTPLNDATIRMIQHAKLGAPWGQKYDRVAIAIMTDGEENASQEYSRLSGGTEKVKRELNICREMGWQVIMLGAGFDNQKQAFSYGSTQSATVETSAINYGTTMRAMAGKRAMYATSGVGMSFTAEEKAALKSTTAIDLNDLPQNTTDTTTEAKNTTV